MENGKIGGIITPKPINRLSKIGTGDYVGDMTTHSKGKGKGGYFYSATYSGNAATSTIVGSGS